MTVAIGLGWMDANSPFSSFIATRPELAFFLGSQINMGHGPATARREQAVRLVSTLSPRQLQILDLMAAGRLTKQIAHQLGLAEKTVKMHRGLLFAKLGARTASEAVRIAVEAGL